MSDSRVFPAVERDPYVSRAAAEAIGARTPQGLALGAAVRMFALGRGNLSSARSFSREIYGENHPATRALIVSAGASGGFIVPPDYVPDLIELLRAEAVVRSAAPRKLAMPRGTLTLPAQLTPAAASYSGETSPIAVSQPTVGALTATYKKLVGFVPVSNDLMRYADPGADAIVRDDLVEVLALREDLAFLFGDGTQNTPRGFAAFAAQWTTQQGGTAAAFNTASPSIAGVNGPVGNPLLSQNGGSYVLSNANPTLITVLAELAGLDALLDAANVKAKRRTIFMHSRTANFLRNMINSLGVFVWRAEMERGTLNGRPYRISNQIPINIIDPAGANDDCSLLLLAEMDEALLFDSMTLELTVSREASFVDGYGVTWNTFQQDITVIRAVAEHDFQMRHASAVAVDQFVRWEPSTL